MIKPHLAALIILVLTFMFRSHLSTPVLAFNVGVGLVLLIVGLFQIGKRRA